MLPQLGDSFPLEGSLGGDGSMRNRSGESGKERGQILFPDRVGKRKEATSGIIRNGNRNVESNLELQL